MIYKRPLRLTILHLAHRFFIEDDTFITTYSFNLRSLDSQSRDYTWACR